MDAIDRGRTPADAGTAALNRRREWLAAATGGMAAIGLSGAAVPFVESLLPSAEALARGGPVTVDASDLAPRKVRIVEWRGRPVWLLRRTDEMIRALQAPNPALADERSLRSRQPASCANALRSQHPDLFVAIGLCTHLGCSPTLHLDENVTGEAPIGGFVCPCHGSRFDLAGRVVKNVPAPTNLEIPDYRIGAGQVVTIGS